MKTLKLTNLLALPLLISTGLPAAQTNLVQTLQIHLLARAQGPTITNGNVIAKTLDNSRLSTHEVIHLLGDATTNNLSDNAVLLVKKPLPDGTPSVIIRDGGKNVEVTSFFSHDVADAKISRGRLNTNTGIATGTEFSYRSFALNDAGSQTVPDHFSVAGLTTANFASLLNNQGKVIGMDYDYIANVTGTGDMNGTPVLFEGTISGVGRKIEIIP